MRSNDAVGVLNHAVPAGEQLVELSIELDARAPRLARDLVKRSLDGVPSAIVERAELIVSELVTNSLRHSDAAPGTQVTVRLSTQRDRCWIEVEDPGGGEVITLRAPDLLHGGGMGLNLVEALSERWGVARGAHGRSCVWAELLYAGSTRPATEPGGDGRDLSDV
jgi:anti-sigma regulatory factor (Ser/Thr protein kinase)